MKILAIDPNASNRLWRFVFAHAVLFGCLLLVAGVVAAVAYVILAGPLQALPPGLRDCSDAASLPILC